MKSIQLIKPGIENLRLVEMDKCSPGPGEICVRVQANSLNYHDYVVVTGTVPTEPGFIPITDGAGHVAALGEGVDQFTVGDKVVTLFVPDWQSGAPNPELMVRAPGHSTQGLAREYICAPAGDFTLAPQGYSAEEASTLPCAALTAWRSLIVEGKLKAGDSVLVMGSGGVSIFALQFAKAAGATVIATSSSNKKLERLEALGADHLINYVETPNWGEQVKVLTHGRGVDHVVEVGGPSTLSQSIEACRYGGHIAFVGILGGMEGDMTMPRATLANLFLNQIRLTGLALGNKAHQQDMIRAIEASGIKPVIDQTFSLENIADAFRLQESQKHFGKICLTV